MADWYVSSAAYAAIPAFQISHAYVIGDIVKPIAPALKAQWAMRCTVAGTSAASEPTWPTTNNGTVASGGATFTNVTGQSTYGWGAAAGDVPTLLGAVGAFRFAAGDRMFVSSDHSETQTAGTIYGSGTATASFTGSQLLSVNRAGSVPPVAPDLMAGAIFTVGTGAVNMLIETGFPLYHYGINYIYTGISSGISITNSAFKAHYFDTCQLYINTSAALAGIYSGQPASVVLNNTTVRFGNVAQGIGPNGGLMEITWLNTPSAIAGATIPTNLFASGQARDAILLTARGVDLSAITTTLVLTTQSGNKYLFDSCRIASGVTRYSAAGVLNTRDLVELINCFDGTNIINESYQPAGSVTTERTITLTGGAQDDVGVFSHKMVSNTNIDKYVNRLTSFWLDIESTLVTGTRTATVEIISSASLNNDEINLLLEYQGTTGSSIASFASSLPATVLTTGSAVTTSTAAWNSMPVTPVKQKLVVTFAPRVAGRVRGQVRLGKASTTVYLNPVLIIG